MDSIEVQGAPPRQWILPDLSHEPLEDSPVLRARLALRRKSADTDADSAHVLSEAKALLLYCVVFLFIYSPAILMSYGMTDSYFDLYSGTHGTLASDTLLIVAEGRWVAAFLITKSYSALHGIAGLRDLRVLSILGIALFAWVLRGTLLRAGIPRAWATAIPLLVCVTPPFQVYAAWDVCWPYPYAACAAGIAAVVARRGLNSIIDRKRIATGVLFFVAAIALLVLSLATYQPAAMVFWLFAAVLLLCDTVRFRRTVLLFAVLGIIMAVALGLDAESGRIIVPLVAGHSFAAPRTQLVTDIHAKVTWFFQQPLLDALNVYNLFPMVTIAVAVSALGVLGLFVYLPGPLAVRLGKVGIAVLLLPLSYLPNMVVAESWASYRTQVGLTSLCVLYVALGALAMFQRGNSFIRVSVANMVLASVMVVISLIATRNVMRDFALPQSEELAVLQTQLVSGRLDTATSIYMIPSTWDDSAAADTRYDEFGTPTSAVAWSQKPMTYFVLEEIDPARANLPIKVGPADGSGTPPPGSLVIDMRLLRDARPYPSPLG